ncbi:hypothetical protein B296_00017129 [Ensete ventricosum]|uniref:Uncharacterized protein n=1 Tax=Ensete ventricosum TaxID=4639 RepID=A0A427B585_ENSVE|nr:hypothetical protein B296_00017129 [Ensete ventricosum]
MEEAGGKCRGFERWKLRERRDLRLLLEMIWMKATAMRRKERAGILSSLGPGWGCVCVHGSDTSSRGYEEGLRITQSKGTETSTHGSTHQTPHLSRSNNVRTIIGPQGPICGHQCNSKRAHRTAHKAHYAIDHSPIHPSKVRVEVASKNLIHAPPLPYPGCASRGSTSSSPPLSSPLTAVMAPSSASERPRRGDGLPFLCFAGRSVQSLTTNILSHLPFSPFKPNLTTPTAKSPMASPPGGSASITLPLLLPPSSPSSSAGSSSHHGMSQGAALPSPSPSSAVKSFASGMRIEGLIPNSKTGGGPAFVGQVFSMLDPSGNGLMTVTTRFDIPFLSKRLNHSFFHELDKVINFRLDQISWDLDEMNQYLSNFDLLV